MICCSADRVLSTYVPRMPTAHGGKEEREREREMLMGEVGLIPHMSCMYVHVCHPVHSMFCPLHIRRKKVASSPPCPDLIPTAPLLFGFALLTCLPLVPISSSSSLASSLSPPLEWISPSDERDRLRGSNEEGGGGGRKNEAVVHYTLHSTVAYARS